jgi:hypothetical protein
MVSVTAAHRWFMLLQGTSRGKRYHLQSQLPKKCLALKTHYFPGGSEWVMSDKETEAQSRDVAPSTKPPSQL